VSNELRALYHDVIVDHSKRPRNCRPLPGAARTAEGYNALCGDKVTVYVDLVADVLMDVGFQATACAIALASASLMTEVVKGMSQAEVAELCNRFRALVTVGPDAAGDFGDLAAFASVRAFPSRVKCALLAWNTLQAALRAD
jgi:nitrogen fixation NifU-like protein